MKGPLWALLLLGAAGCNKESSQVRDARDAFFSAMARVDEARMRASVAPGFLSVRGGRLLTIDSLISDLTALQQDSLPVLYAFADSAIAVDPPMAWIVFRSREIVRQPSLVDTTFAIESAIFHRDGGGWRLTLLHTSPISDGPSFFDTKARPARGDAPARPPAPPAKTGPSKAPPRR